MDAEGLGRELLLTPPPPDPRRTTEKQTVGTVQHLIKFYLCKHFRALSMLALQREAAWAEERLLGDLWQTVPQNGRVHLLGIDFFSLTFRSPPRYPGKNPGISRQKSLVSLGFEGHTELFDHHPFTWKTPTLPEGIRTSKFRFGFLFLP